MSVGAGESRTCCVLSHTLYFRFVHINFSLLACAPSPPLSARFKDTSMHGTRGKRREWKEREVMSKSHTHVRLPLRTRINVPKRRQHLR